MESELGSLYVSFSSRGSKELDRAIDDKESKLSRAAKAAGGFAKGLAGGIAGLAAQALGKLQEIQQNALRNVAIGVAAIGGVVAKGLSGTKEAETLGSAFQLLSRTIADLFAPAIRGVIDVIANLVEWWQKLDPATRRTVQNFALVAAGVVAAIAAFKLLATVVSTAIGILLNPFIMIPVLVAGAVAAILYLTASGETFEEKMTSVIENVIIAWHALKGAILGVWAVLKEVFAPIGAFFKATGQALTGNFAAAGRTLSTIRFPDISGAFSKEWNKAKEEMKGARPLAEWLVNKGKEFLNMFGGDRKPLQMKMQIDFGTLDSVWERLHKAVNEGGDERQQRLQQLEMNRRMASNFDQLMREGVKISNLPAVVV